MFKSALVYIIAVVILPLFFIFMTAKHPNYHNQFDDKRAAKIVSVTKR